MGKKEFQSPKGKPDDNQERELLLKELKEETNFLKYMEILKIFAKEYCVMISAQDTLGFRVAAREISDALMEMGLRMEYHGKRINLYKRIRFSYAAMIDAGQVIFEELRCGGSVETKITVGEWEAELISASTSTTDPKGLILINGKDRSLNMRGLNIVVFDKSSGMVLDTTNFDIFEPDVPRIFINEQEQTLREFTETHPGVSLICLQLPAFPSFVGGRLTRKERSILKNRIENMGGVFARQDDLVLNEYFDKEGVAEVLNTPKSYLDWNGVRRFEDRHGKHINVSGGHRETAYQPNRFQRTIFLVGGCIIFGIGCDDSRTIASWLQLQCGKEVPEAGIIVRNYGFFRAGSAVEFEQTTKILNDLPVKPGDIVIYQFQPEKAVPNSAEFTTINLLRAAVRPRDYEVFYDTVHFTPDGSRLIAEGIFKGLMDLGFVQQNKSGSGDYPGSDLRSISSFPEYLRLLKKYAQRYCVLASAWDMSDGPGFTEEIAALYREVGFQANLMRKSFWAYAAAIGAGELAYEELLEDSTQYIDITVTDESRGFEANLVSKGPNSGQSEKSPIEINGSSYPLKRGGLHFIVYDKIRQTVIDAVNFDISLDSAPCSRHLEYIPDGVLPLGSTPMGVAGRMDAEILTAVDQPVVEAAQKDLPFEADTYKELAEYKRALTNWYERTLSFIIGSVVMNCNPFTLGHRYLVEQALTQCDFLIIFVVQEDKSRFPFEDRLRLVKEGVADLKNAAVLPSGKFVLSSLTFSEYFNKAELQDRMIDTSLDVTVFAREVAPCLHITKRFVGEEPFDAVTRQYNETMRRILPEYGIELIEVPRKTDACGKGTAISASRVRELLEKGDFDAIRTLVPESTFQYLKGL